MLDNNINLRRLNVNVNCKVQPTNMVLYLEDIESYIIQIFLLDGRNYFYINKDCNLTIKIDDTEVPNAFYTIRDLYKGQIDLKLSKNWILSQESGICHKIVINLYFESTFGKSSKRVEIPFKILNGTDNLLQNFRVQNQINNNTTVPEPTLTYKPFDQ